MIKTSDLSESNQAYLQMAFNNNCLILVNFSLNKRIFMIYLRKIVMSKKKKKIKSLFLNKKTFKSISCNPNFQSEITL